MDMLTDHGVALRDMLTTRYGLSPDAALTMMMAVHNGGGSQAQFSHPELGGMGQWSMGGMTMVGDMFNTGLQAHVANICSEISTAYYQGSFYPPRPMPTWNSQGQAQGGASLQIQGGSFGNWWPDELGQPSSSGAQNNLRYAIFPQARRLAIDLNGILTIYDTGDHMIGGVGQQQSGDASWTFTSQFGTVYLNQLPVVIGNVTEPQNAAPQAQNPVFDPVPEPMPTPAAPQNSTPSAPYDPAPAALGISSADEIFSTLERLGALREKGIILEEEFAAKKSELLARL